MSFHGQEKSETQQAVITGLRSDFAREIGAFIEAAGIPSDSPFRFQPDAPNGEPVFLVTGATFLPFDPEQHGFDPAHAKYETNGITYLMNNTAALLVRLMDEGRRIIVHGGASEIIKGIVDAHRDAANVAVITGDPGKPEVLQSIYAELEAMSAQKPISSLRMALYQSFAQATGEPFKPMHIEPVAEVERAAAKRLRFVYNMAAMGYDFLVNRGLESLRIVSLSALASQRATYGLLADATDKYMNELAWRTFHLESNASTGKPVSVYQINPGITASCDVYQRESVRQIVNRESVADGFPLEDDVLEGNKPLPAISANDVAWVANAMLTTEDNNDPNPDMPQSVKQLLYGGFAPEELRERFEKAVRIEDGDIAVDPDHMLPEHMLAAATQYGSLPSTIKPGDYRRISLCPPGQKF